MIEKTVAFKTAAGVFPTIEEAQKAELHNLWAPDEPKTPKASPEAVNAALQDSKQ